MRTRVGQAAVLVALCAATIGLTASCGGGSLPGLPAPASVTPSPDGTPAHPYTAAWLDNELLKNEDLAGSKVVKADCKPGHVDAGGAGDYDCVVTMADGRKYDDGFDVSEGIVSQLGPGVPLN